MSDPLRINKDDKAKLHLYFISILLGILVGVIGTGFHLSVDYFSHFSEQICFWLFKSFHIPIVFSTIILCSSMIFVAYHLVKRFANEASGSGVPEIEGYLLNLRPMNWRRLLPIKFIGGTLAIGSKMVLGREGPTIQIGGNLGQMMGEKCLLNDEKTKLLISAGAAAGLSVAFNAPVAGILFFIEELREKCELNLVSFMVTALCCVMATAIYCVLQGHGPVVQMPLYNTPDIFPLSLFILLGAIIGVVGLFYNQSIMKVLYYLDSKTTRQKKLYCLLIAVLIGYFSIYLPDATGGGYDILLKTLTPENHQSLHFYGLFLMLVLRFSLSVFCYGTGVPGGIFVPILSVGAIVGLIFAKLIFFIWQPATIYADMFIVAAMGGIFSAVVRAPLTGMILIIEMTQNYHLILPSLFTCLTATLIIELAKNKPLYDQFLARTLRNSTKK